VFEVVGNPLNPAKKVVVRCTGLNERGQRCKKRLFDYRAPSRPIPPGVDVGTNEILCSRCGTMNHVRVSGLTP
jgi:hypothetical protein